MTDDAHFRLRIPRSLKEWVEENAKRNNRSINAEIISRLEEIKNREESEADAEEYTAYQKMLRLSSRMDVISDLMLAEAESSKNIKLKKGSKNFSIGVDDLIEISEEKINFYLKRKRELQKEWIDLMSSRQKKNSKVPPK